MVNPSNREGQRWSAICLRTTFGRLGSMRIESAASAATPAVAARRMNFLLVVGKRGNQLSGPKIAEGGASVSDIQNNLFHRSAIERDGCIDQKLNVACRSIRRFAEEPAENGPPCREFEIPKSGEPRTAFGLATLTLLNTLRTLTPNVRL